MNKTASFRYTFPIAKSELRSDGGHYIIGYASGPELDSEMERMSPDAILGFSDQINASSETMRLVYRDAHAPDGVLRDLGEITKAWVNDQMHLGIEVLLDMKNPASQYLWEQITVKGKQYGMSVAGRVMDYVDEFVAEFGKKIRTYKSIILDEISNTTRPAWYPSFGSVLAKSLKDAEENSNEADEIRPSQGNAVKTGQSGQSTVAQQVGTEVSESETTDKGDNPLEDKDLLDVSVKDEVKSDITAGDEDVQKYSSAANDASSAAYVLSSLLAILGGETDEDDTADADKIRVAIAAIQEFITSETAEIGGPNDTVAYSDDSVDETAVVKSDDDTTDDSAAEADAEAADEAEAESAPEEDAEKSDSEDDDDLAKAGKKISAATAAELRTMFENMKAALTTVGVLDAEKSSEESASDESEETVDKSTEAEPVDELVALKATITELTETNAKATARIEELENTTKTDLPGLITDEAQRSESDTFAEVMSKASPREKLRLAMAAQTRGR